jgi:hypothetical protein
VHDPTKDEAAAPSNPHTKVGGQTAGLGGLTASSCRVDDSSSTNGISSPTSMEDVIPSFYAKTKYSPYVCPGSIVPHIRTKSVHR